MSGTTFEAAVASGLAEASRLQARRLVRGLAWTAAAIAVLWFTGAQIGMNPVTLVKGIPFMADFFSRMFPPNLLHLPLLGDATLETIQIAVWGTLIAILLSIPLAILAPGTSRLTRFSTTPRACS